MLVSPPSVCSNAVGAHLGARQQRQDPREAVAQDSLHGVLPRFHGKARIAGYQGCTLCCPLLYSYESGFDSTSSS